MHHHNAMLASTLPAWRSKFVVIGLSAAFLALAGRAYWVQVVDREFYIGEGQKRYQRTLALSVTRGRIVDRNGAMLAVSLATYEVWASPKLFDSDHGNEIARLLKMPPRNPQKRMDAGRSFVLLKRQVEADAAERIAHIGRAGITLVPDTKRFYPEGESVAHIVGFTNNEDRGQEGVELAADARLTGEAGQREVIRDRLGRVVSQIGETDLPQNGETIQLTIDRRI